MKPKINPIWLLPVILMLCIGAECAFAQTTASDQAFEIGMTLYKTAKYTEAIAEWEKLLANDPSYAKKEDVWYLIAVAAVDSRSYDKAVVYLDKIVSQKDANGNPVRGPYYPHALFLIGRSLFSAAEQHRASGNTTQAGNSALLAKEKFDQLLTEYPDSPNVPQTLFYQTQIAFKFLQSATETLKYTEQAQAKIPNDTASNVKMRDDCRFYHAWALGQLGQETQARVIFGEFITKKDPDRGPLSLYELAFTYFRTGEYQRTLNELDSYRRHFPSDTTASLDILRLQAMCYYQMENYPTATELMKNVVEQQEQQNIPVPVGDDIYLVLSLIKTRQFDVANRFIEHLEWKYASSNFTDGISLLRAHYYAEMQPPQYQNAINVITPIIGLSQSYMGNSVSFSKRPFNSETGGADKCGLTEEHFLRAASLSAICYAYLGQRDTANQIYNAMLQLSPEMYGRYSSIRDKTLERLNQIAVSPVPLATVNVPPTVTGGTTSGSSTTAVSTGSTSWTSPAASIIQQPGGNNSLANRPMTADEQEEILKQLYSRANSPEGNEGYADEVISELNLLLHNYSLAQYPYNVARAAVLRGNLLYEKKDVAQAIVMFDLAYESIPPGSSFRDTETFEQAAFCLGRNAGINGDFVNAAKYYSEALATTAGKKEEFRSGLMYRLGNSLLNIPDMKREGLGYFFQIYTDEKASKYWSHAALQVAIDDFNEGKNNSVRYEDCEKVIDDLIFFRPNSTILDRVLYLKGELAMRNKQWDIAAESFDAIRDYTPNSPFVGPAMQKLSDVRSQTRQTTR